MRLADLTTLRVGGEISTYIEATSEEEMIEAVRIAKERLEHVIEEFGPAWSLAPIVRAMQSELARQIRTVS